MIQNQSEAWKDIFKFLKITDKDIDKINRGKYSKSSDRAKCGALKLYTYESDLYKKLNYAL